MVRRQDLNHRNNPRFVAGNRVVETGKNPVDTVRVTRGAALKRAREQQEALAAQKPRPISSWKHLAPRPPQHPLRGRPSAKIVEPPTRLRRILKSVPLPVPLTCKQRRKRRRNQQIMDSVAARKLRDAKTVLRAPVIMSKTMKFMDALHMPYLPPNCNWSQLKCLLHLNWTIHLENSENSLFRPHSSTVDDGPVPSNPIRPDTTLYTGSYHSRFPALDNPPLHSPAAILNSQSLRRYHHLNHGYVEIPTSWTPIQNLHSYDLQDVPEGKPNSSSSGSENDLVNLENPDLKQRKSKLKPEGTLPKLLNFMEPGGVRHIGAGASSQEGVLDLPLSNNISEGPMDLRRSVARHSSERNNPASPTGPTSQIENPASETDRSETPMSVVSSGSEDTPTTPGSPYRITRINFTPKSNFHLHVIHDWEMAAVMNPELFGWTRQEPDIMRQREQIRHVRSLLSDRQLPNSDTYPSGSCARFLSSYMRDPESAPEGGPGQLIGRIFADIISTASISAHRSIRKYTLPSWRCPVSPTKIDIGCIPTQEALPWDQRVMPILLAAQFSEGRYGHDRRAAETIACTLHPTMMLLILYYLDTRSQIEDSLPSWMIIYGIIYTPSGFSIHEHYPDYHPGVAGSPPRWTSSSRWRAQFEYGFNRPPSERGHSLAALLRISGHTQFVLENLRKWDGYQRIIKSNFMS